MFTLSAVPAQSVLALGWVIVRGGALDPAGNTRMRKEIGLLRSTVIAFLSTPRIELLTPLFTNSQAMRWHSAHISALVFTHAVRSGLTWTGVLPVVAKEGFCMNALRPGKSPSQL